MRWTPSRAFDFERARLPQQDAGDRLAWRQAARPQIRRHRDAVQHAAVAVQQIDHALHRQAEEAFALVQAVEPDRQRQHALDAGGPVRHREGQDQDRKRRVRLLDVAAQERRPGRHGLAEILLLRRVLGQMVRVVAADRRAPGIEQGQRGVDRKRPDGPAQGLGAGGRIRRARTRRHRLAARDVQQQVGSSSRSRHDDRSRPRPRSCATESRNRSA